MPALLLSLARLLGSLSSVSAPPVDVSPGGGRGAPWDWYTMQMGVVPAGGNTTAIRTVAVGPNASLAPCVAACDAMVVGCQGFAVDSMSVRPPSYCELHGHIDRPLINAPCGLTPDTKAAQFGAFFTKSPPAPGATIPGPVPYQQFAGLMSPLRTAVAATVSTNGSFATCVAACDADPL